ncbi:putative reverse transcriptase domain-containing protein [Tanacetum coccineum]|uniref:Reverse transcriptase domain-containing protein n=1 Tax=Tanacetum coccineum TaxID=301880 RepID=A0ABQ5IW10_9ASTR
MFIRKYRPRNEVKQMEKELWNLKVKGTNLTTYNQRFQELILLCPEMVPNTDRLLERYIEGLPLNIKGNVNSSKPVDLHEAIEIAQGLMYQVVQGLGENSGDNWKWNGNHYNNNNPNTTSNLNLNKHPETTRVFTAGQEGHDIKLMTVEPHHVPQAKEDPEAKEDREVKETCFHEKNYTTHDLELGAVVFSLKMWRHYLYGIKCVVFTDHKSLQHILDQKERNMRQRRWLELLSDYDCEIRSHNPGKGNVARCP